MQTVNVRSSKRVELIDITAQVKEIVRSLGVEKGHLLIYVPHTTAAVTVNEGADPSVAQDIIQALEHLAPHGAPFYQHLEGNSDAHIKASLLGASECIPLKDGAPVLGTWQSIFFAEFDGPRQRRVYLSLSG